MTQSIDPEHNTQSWDAFWEELHAQDATEVIQGVEVRIPTDVSLSFAQRLGELREDDGEEAFRDLVAELYGADVLDQWIAKGMTLTGIQVALGWGYARASGQDITFRQAYDLLKQSQGNPAAANRAQRRAASKSPSTAGGGPSKRTSSASTASTRKKSRS